MAFPEKLDSAERFCRFLDSTDTFLFDCDGVLWQGNTVVPGAPAVLESLKKLGKSIFLITNNSTKSREEYVEKCKNLGFRIELDEIVCTAYVTAQYLKNVRHFTGKIYLMGSNGIAQELDEVNVQYIGVGPDPIRGTLNDWTKIELDPEVTCVVVGFDEHVSYKKIMLAASYLKNKDCLFVATNEDTQLPVERRDIIVPGSGVNVACVSAASGRQPDIVMGKPHKPIIDVVLNSHDLNPSRTVMIGDRLNTDISLANRYGLQSILVLTGVSTLEDVETCVKSNSQESKNQIPKYFLECVTDVAKFL